MRSVRLARRELASLRAEKTLLLAILVQLAVAAFSSVLFVGLVSLYAAGGAAGSGVVVDVGVTGNATNVIAPVVADDRTRTVSRFENRSEALAAFTDGTVDAVIVGRHRPAGNISVEAIAPEGDFRTTLVVVQLRDALASLERSLRDRYADRLVREPVEMPDPVGGSPFFGFAYTILVPLLVLMPAFISGSVIVDSVTEELDRGTLDLLRVAPVSAGEIIDGKALAATAIAPLQGVAWLVLLAANGTLVARPLVIVLILTALAMLFVAVGAALAITVRDRRNAQFLYSMATLGLVAVGTVLPEGPINVIAKFAIGSPTPGSWVICAVMVLAALLGYGLARHHAAALIDSV